MCLNEIYSKACIDKLLCDAFPIQSGLKPGDALSPLLFSFSLEQHGHRVTCELQCGSRTSLVRLMQDTFNSVWVLRTKYFD
jgi:hypothetical protein